MKLVVGLGNPGRQYNGTRHNVGFEVIDRLAGRYGLRSKEKFFGYWYELRNDREPAGLLKPLTYMNLSGRSVRAACDFYRLDPSSVLVVCDDFQLDVARLRFRRGGSAGGQKGLANIIQQMGTEAVPRLRVGIGVPPQPWDRVDYVLGRFDSDQQQEMQRTWGRTGDAVEDWIAHGTDFCMNKYNARGDQD